MSSPLASKRSIRRPRSPSLNPPKLLPPAQPPSRFPARSSRVTNSFLFLAAIVRRPNPRGTRHAANRVKAHQENCSFRVTLRQSNFTETRGNHETLHPGPPYFLFRFMLAPLRRRGRY